LMVHVVVIVAYLLSLSFTLSQKRARAL